MKQMFFYFLLFVLAGVGACKGRESQPTPVKAILETSATGEFRLSDKAIRTIGLVMQPIQSASETIPESALVHSLDKMGVYRFRKGWFKFIPLETRSAELASGDQIVVQGVALLRVAEMDAFGGEE